VDSTSLVALIVAGIAAASALATAVFTAAKTKAREEEARQFQTRIEKENAEREEKSRSREAETKTRVAARLVQADLAWNRTRIKQALAKDEQKYWSSTYSLQQDAWDHQREILARSLTFEHWDDVRRAFRWTAALELQAAQRRVSTHEKRPVLTDHGVDQLEKASRAVTKAVEILEADAQGVAIEEPSDEEPN
jgi:hypothetical protein